MYITNLWGILKYLLGAFRKEPTGGEKESTVEEKEKVLCIC